MARITKKQQAELWMAEYKARRAALPTVKVTVRFGSEVEQREVVVEDFSVTGAERSLMPHAGHAYIDVYALVRYRTGTKVHGARVPAFLNKDGEYELNTSTRPSRDFINGGRWVRVVGLYDPAKATSKW